MRILRKLQQLQELQKFAILVMFVKVAVLVESFWRLYSGFFQLCEFSHAVFVNFVEAFNPGHISLAQLVWHKSTEREVADSNPRKAEMIDTANLTLNCGCVEVNWVVKQEKLNSLYGTCTILLSSLCPSLIEALSKPNRSQTSVTFTLSILE